MMKGHVLIENTGMSKTRLICVFTGVKQQQQQQQQQQQADRKIIFTCASHNCRVFTSISDGVKGSSCDGRTGTRTLNFVC